MLPHTCRVGDLVEVIEYGHKFHGRIGKVVKKTYIKITVDFYGKLIDFLPSSLILKARIGTAKYKVLEETIQENYTHNLTREDLNDLINYALDIRDFEWAYELKQRRDS
ncbi:hypothetical protein BXO87_02215 [Bacillus sp. GZB]|uniref:hypothetical protein n=1 Tax=Bacillus TaxID=1386 RepID=UPI000977C288|nr:MULTISPECIES: hypothetical protein [Bacillus]MCZ4246941.1 hypothetical protein [Bacillus amyloliquefaciens]OMQ06840.1 hypothetical protein BXO87_02215 [Bacillus sp. GZB]